MAEFPDIPEGYAVPLVDTDTYRLPTPTMEAIAESTELSNTFVGPLAKTAPGAAAKLTYINAADFGANPNNTGDQTAALQAALDAAGQGGTVRISNGAIYRCTGTLTVPAWCTIEAPTSGFGAGGTAPAEIRFAISGSTVGITLGAYAELRNLLVRGPGDAVGSCIGIAGASATLDYVSVLQFPVGVHLTGAYYAHANRLRLQRNAVGLKLTGCYNVSLFNPSIYGWKLSDNTPGTGIEGAGRALSIFGGSIESCRYGVTVSAGQTLNLFGTYFENMIPADQSWPGTGVFHGVLARDISNVTINAHGCEVYLNHMTSFVTTINTTDCTFVAKGNKFIAVSASVTAPASYVVSHGQSVDVGPDHTSEVVKAGATYVSVAGGMPVRGGVVHSGGAVYDGRARTRASNTVTHSADGAVTLDAAQYTDFTLNLSANVTGMTISNPIANQEISITVKQDATGGRTYVFPASARFAGGAAPSSTTANTYTTVILRWDNLNGRWREVSRSVAIPA